MKLIPKGWSNFQHYKDRKPSWIKLHRELLDDYEFSCLPIASKALAPMLWLLASEYQDGIITADPIKIAFRLRISEKELLSALKPLIASGFFIDDSKALADCKQVASLEKERERETEKETEGESEREGARKRASRLDPNLTIPTEWYDFCRSERQDLDPKKTFERFKDYWISKPGKDGTKTDWLATWRNWVRNEKSQGGSRFLTLEQRNQAAADAFVYGDQPQGRIIDVN